MKFELFALYSGGPPQCALADTAPDVYLIQDIGIYLPGEVSHDLDL
jgi:hypothetical protein